MNCWASSLAMMACCRSRTPIFSSAAAPHATSSSASNDPLEYFLITIHSFAVRYLGVTLSRDCQRDTTTRAPTPDPPDVPRAADTSPADSHLLERAGILTQKVRPNSN